MSKKHERGRMKPLSVEITRDLAVRLQNLRDELGRYGLFRTYQKMDEPLKALGYEAAKMLAKAPNA